MAVRSPLKYNGSQLQEMTTAEVLEYTKLAIYYYSLNPTVTLAVSSSSGNLTSIDDTRLQAGAVSTSSSAFPDEATTAEPSEVTIAYQRITQTASAITPTSDTGTTFPVYYTSAGAIQAMNVTDILDTFAHPAITLMTTTSTTSDQAGTYHVSTGTSVSGSTLVSSTPIFTDTRADTSAYSAAGIPETLDQPTTITNYYLHQIDGANSTPSVAPLLINGDANLQQSTSATLGALLGEYVRSEAVSSTGGYTIRYNIDGSGNARGSSIVNTILSGGSGNRQTLQVGDEYRAQEFPDGTASTANTYVFKILKA